MPVRRHFVTQAHVERQVSRHFEVILKVVGLSPAAQVNVGVPDSHFRVAAYSHQKRCQRKAATTIQGCCSIIGKNELPSSNVVSEYVDLLAPEIHSSFEE